MLCDYITHGNKIAQLLQEDGEEERALIYLRKSVVYMPGMSFQLVSRSSLSANDNQGIRPL